MDALWMIPGAIVGVTGYFAMEWAVYRVARWRDDARHVSAIRKYNKKVNAEDWI